MQAIFLLGKPFLLRNYTVLLLLWCMGLLFVLRFTPRIGFAKRLLTPSHILNQRGKYWLCGRTNQIHNIYKINMHFIKILSADHFVPNYGDDRNFFASMFCKWELKKIQYIMFTHLCLQGNVLFPWADHMTVHAGMECIVASVLTLCALCSRTNGRVCTVMDSRLKGLGFNFHCLACTEMPGKIHIPFFLCLSSSDYLIMWQIVAVFLCCIHDCASCLTHLICIGWTSWAIWAAITQYSLRVAEVASVLYNVWLYSHV